MPDYAVAQLEAAYGDLAGARVAVLGAAYRGGVKETAFSGVFPVVAALRARGAHVAVHDPMFSDAELRAFGWEPYHFGDAVDAVVIQTDHSDYRDVLPEQLPGVMAVLDGRQVLDPVRWTGIHIAGLGRGVGPFTRGN